MGSEGGGKDSPGVTPARSPARAKTQRAYESRVRDIEDKADREQAEREAISDLKGRNTKAKNRLEDPLRAILDPTARIDAILGNKMRSMIAEDIRLGGTIVRDAKTGQVVGSTSKNALGFEVYTGRSEFSPIGRTDVARTKYGYNVSAAEAPQGGDGPDKSVVTASTDTSAPTTPTAKATGVSTGARRSMLASRQSGAARRLFIT